MNQQQFVCSFSVVVLCDSTISSVQTPDVIPAKMTNFKFFNSSTGKDFCVLDVNRENAVDRKVFVKIVMGELVA